MDKIYRPCIFPYWVLDEFELLDILIEARKNFSHVVFTSSNIDDGFSEPISVDDENPEVIYKEGAYKLKVYKATTEICTPVVKDLDEPHYRDLEYRHKKKRF